MKVLITAGPTWVKIDDVRIVTNVFTGRSGLYLAQQFRKKGHSVTLVINPHCLGKIKGMKVIPFHYFEDFKKAVSEELKSSFYDAVIHTAAVSDYKLRSVFKGKIASGKDELVLNMKPAEKIIKTIRRLARKSVLIQFKLEAERKGLVDKAYNSLVENKSDFVVANALRDLKRKYKAFIIDRNKDIIEVNSKPGLFNNLCDVIARV
jgi:phosphopantothenoylcysteine synthetase/decarboxylase